MFDENLGMSLDTTIRITLHRDDLSPAQLSASDLADLIKKIEALIIAETEYQNPRLISEQDIFISLIAVKSGSIDLTFQPNHNALISVVSEITRAIYNHKLDTLSPDGYNKLRDLRDHLKKPQLYLRIHDRNYTAEITPDLSLDDLPMIESPTVLYGELLQIGGKSPRAKMILGNGKGINCYFEKSQGRDLIKQLASKIYTWVGLRGLAKLNPIDLSIRTFHVEGIADFEDYPADENMAVLKELLAPYYRDILNPDELVTDLRSENWGD